MNDNSNTDFTVDKLKLIHETLTVRYEKSIHAERTDIIFYNANTHSF
jgi:hypothetical protein